MFPASTGMNAARFRTSTENFFRNLETRDLQGTRVAARRTDREQITKLVGTILNTLVKADQMWSDNEIAPVAA